MGTPKAYSTKSVIFLEAPAFERIREHYLDDDQYQLLQAALMANPDYYRVARNSHILFLTVYCKSEMADLAQKDIKALAALVKGLK